jgi:hypothetical protein
MRSTLILPLLAACGLLWFAASAASAQQVTVGSPFHAINDSFFEQMGFGFGLAVPQFGGFGPGAGMSGGAQAWGRRGNASLFWQFGQGSRRSFVSQTPSITLTNGQPGSISDISQSPFVVGVVPIVGGFLEGFPIGIAPQYTLGYPIPVGPQFQAAPQGDSPVRAMMRQGELPAGLPGGGAAPPEARPHRSGDRAAGIDPAAAPAAGIDPAAQKLAAAQSSSAGRAVPSVAEARRMRQVEQATQNAEALVQFERGLTAEEGGKPGVAKIYYNMALKRADGELRSRILARLKAVGSSSSP